LCAPPAPPPTAPASVTVRAGTAGPNGEACSSCTIMSAWPRGGSAVGPAAAVMVSPPEEPSDMATAHAEIERAPPPRLPK